MASAQSLGAYSRGISGAGITMRYKRIFERASLYRRLKGRVKKIRKLPLGHFTYSFISEMREDP